MIRYSRIRGITRTGCAGIISASGYLDQLQYPDAIQAFNEVVKLRPDYADGYTNIALTEIQWEKYGVRPRQHRKGSGAQPQQRARTLL